jgi:hypothetical protein
MPKSFIRDADSTVNCVSVIWDVIKTKCKWERIRKERVTVYLLYGHSPQRNDDTTRTGGDPLTNANRFPL